jgi:hypothetical protein
MHRAMWHGEALATIWFQGRRLPPWAIILDVSTTNNILGPEDPIDPSGDIAIWWWHFASCTGVRRWEESPVVLKNAQVLRQQLELRAEDFQALIRRNFRPTKVNAEEVFHDWLEALDIIMAEARKSRRCIWYGGYEGPGPHYSDPEMAPPWGSDPDRHRVEA